jgi:signal transduction histidine kinase/ActR/RegA family two-component response regulator
MPDRRNQVFIKPIFEAISIWVSHNLNADYFALAISDVNGISGNLYLNKKADHRLAEALEAKLMPFIVGPKSGVSSAQEKSGEILSRDNDDDQIVRIVKETLGCKKVLVTPITIEDIGESILIWAWVKTPANYSAAIIEKATLIADHVALSLKLSLKEKKGQDLNAKLAALLELSTAIYSSLNYTEVLEKAVSLSMEIVGADGGSLFILDKKNQILKPLITVDARHEEEISKITLKVGEGLTGLVAQNGIGVISNHSENDPRAVQVPGTPQDPESIISAPLTWSGEVIGVVTLRSESCKDFQQEDLDILTIFARQTADAIENAKLFDSLEKAYQELASTQEQLIMTEKLRALGEMAGGVAHDFNNVLGAILGRTQLLLRDVEEPKLVKHLRQIEQMTLAGAKTIQRLQNFTRVSSSGRYESIDLIKIVEDAIEMTRPRWKDQCQRGGIAIDLQFEHKEKLSVMGNPSELAEAFSNLIMNSIDALPQGGTITISSVRQNDKAVLTFQDTGVGMDEVTLKRIFFPFFTTKGRQGTGMGLSVVYGIINRHRGEIDVTSKIGNGTAFTILLPVSQESSQAMVMPTQPIQVSRARVLLVDDDENIRSVISDMLDLLGHQVMAAPCGEDGLKLFQKHEFDLVITDLGMPGISGWDVTRTCKGLKPQVPVIMISGWGNQIDEDMIAQSRLNGVLAKPFEMNKIKAMLNKVLSEQSAQTDIKVS